MLMLKDILHDYSSSKSKYRISVIKQREKYVNLQILYVMLNHHDHSYWMNLLFVDHEYLLEVLRKYFLKKFLFLYPNRVSHLRNLVD
jgi:hypothetical protein